MGADNLQDHRILLFHSSITCIYFVGILFFLHYSDTLYNVGSFKFITVLSTLVLAELIKLSFTNVQLKTAHVGSLDHNASKSMKSIIKRIRDIVKLITVLGGITIIYYIAIVLFGAPLLTHYEETLMLALTLTTFTLIPACLHLGIDNAITLFTDVQYPVKGVFADAVKLNIKAVLLGTWLGAFVLPLDWDRPWQVWPIPCVVGALLGYFTAHFITFLKISTTKLKKKSKKGDTFKSC